MVGSLRARRALHSALKRRLQPHSNSIGAQLALHDGMHALC